MARFLALLGACSCATALAPTTAASGCSGAHVDDGHVLKAQGASVRVRALDRGRKVIVLRGVPGKAVRRELDGGETCKVGLDRFEGRWKRLGYELHARLGRHAIRVTAVHYDPERRVLRTRGRVERSGPRQTVDSTLIVYASTFVPFDSSF
jgi:hypothetical protein